MRETRYVEIAVEGPLRGTFNYSWTAPLGEIPRPGARVVVPFGRLRKTGYVLREVTEETAVAAAGGRELREVAYVKDREESLLAPGVLELARWIARHYLVGLGEVLSAALPSGVRKDARAARQKLVVRLAPREELLEVAQRHARRAKKRAAALRVLAEREEIPAAELTGGKSDAALVRWLVQEGLAEVREVVRDEIALPEAAPAEPSFELTPAQRDALERIHSLASAARRGEAPFGLLLEGVTASGKTEVYLRAIAEEVARGRQAIVLVPEIALTPQTMRRFGERFRRLAVLHSRTPAGVRADAWRRIRSGEVDVVVGARSAVFAPLPKLGLIVVDEEHETSYKQASNPRYHARDVALARGRIEHAVVILGSATPSLESYLAARRGGLAHAVLPERIGGRPLPPVEVVDMGKERAESRRAGAGAGYRVLSRRLETLLREAVSRGEQTILFLNRRGYATYLHCPRCGGDVRCPKCDVPLTLHRSRRRKPRKNEAPAEPKPLPLREGVVSTAATPHPSPPPQGSREPPAALRCHYCGAERPRPAGCPSCGFAKLLALGTGTERVVETVQRAAPAAHVLRMDTDSMKRGGTQQDYERALRSFAEGRFDVLVGTQMIAKGLDLPRVTLVGVVNADVALHMPDFRASERAFQLIAQVAGRAGRSDLGGQVVVQTSVPDALPIRAGARHDIALFAEEELEHRKLFGYPPFTHLARIVVEGPREETVHKKVARVAQALRPEGASAYTVLGPAEAPLGKLRGRRRQHLVIKAEDAETLEEVLWSAEKALRTSGKTRVIVDVDPVNMR